MVEGIFDIRNRVYCVVVCVCLEGGIVENEFMWIVLLLVFFVELVA